MTGHIQGGIADAISGAGTAVGLCRWHRQEYQPDFAFVDVLSDWIAGHIWAGIAGAISGAGTALGLCAWGYLTWQHRREKQALLYSITTRIMPPHLTDTVDNPAASPGTAAATLSFQSRAGSNATLLTTGDFLLGDSTTTATSEMKEVARDIATWCFLRWSGKLGTRAGSDSLGNRAGIWNSRFEDVRCAVMLLAFERVNAALKDKHSADGAGMMQALHWHMHWQKLSRGARAFKQLLVSLQVNRICTGTH